MRRTKSTEDRNTAPVKKRALKSGNSTAQRLENLNRVHVQRAEMAAIVESSHDAIIGKSLEGIITSWNRSAETIYGYTAAEAIGKPISMIVAPEKQHEIPQWFEKLKRNERIQSFETERITKTGERLIISLTLSPIHDSRGRIVGVSGIDRDITKQKMAEQQLAEAQERLGRYAEELEKQVAERTRILKETVQSLEGVCYTIAHDLRAPLRTLQGFTRILVEDYAPVLDAEGRLYAERIGAAATRMDVLIRDLLDYARLSHLELPLRSLDLRHQLEQVLSQLAPEIEAKQAEIVVGPLPRIIANETVLSQVITNLLTNAIKFVGPQTRPHIDIRADTIGRKVRMFVRDNGIGIDPAHHERIFALFQRLHKPEAYPGTGVGLAIVRKGIERMGGAVGVESTPGNGSCFYIDLRLPSN